MRSSVLRLCDLEYKVTKFFFVCLFHPRVLHPSDMSSQVTPTSKVGFQQVLVVSEGWGRAIESSRPG